MMSFLRSPPPTTLHFASHRKERTGLKARYLAGFRQLSIVRVPMTIEGTGREGDAKIRETTRPLPLQFPANPGVARHISLDEAWWQTSANNFEDNYLHP